MTPQEQFVYVLWAYAAAAIVMAGIVGYTLYRSRAQARALADLETKGVKRRSDRV